MKPDTADKTIMSPLENEDTKLAKDIETTEEATETAEPKVLEEHPTLSEVISETAREDERPQSSKLTLREILGGDILYTQQIRNQIWLILLIAFFAIIYVGNRYGCQKNLIEIDKLNNTLQKTKYKTLAISSELTEICRESNVLNYLKNSPDSALKIPVQPPFIITVPEK